MIVEITSTNPNLMSILRKNPNSFSGIQLRSMKNGVVIGRCMSAERYDLVFQDTKYSFSEDTTNQIDFQSYCNPRVFLSMASIFLRHLLAERGNYLGQLIPWLGVTHEELDTEGFEHTIRIPNVYADGFSPERGFVLSSYFPEITLTHKQGRLFSLSITSTQSVFHLINLASLAMVYMAATNRQGWWISKDMISKYVRVLKNLAPIPYFVLYLFGRNCVRAEKDFQYFKPILEECSDQSLDLSWGSTQNMRIQEVGDRMLEDGVIPYNVVEIGCAEMDYPRRYITKLDPHRTWWAHDIVDYSHVAQRIRSRFGVDNLWFVKDQDEIDTGQDLPEHNTLLLMVEVIEHMPLEEAKSFTRTMLDVHAPKKAIITTPNAGFNKNFGINRFRHADHHFELTSPEFTSFIQEALEGMEREYKVIPFGIGDRVGEEYLSLGIEIIFE
jgi:hypothetical protein